MTQHIEIEFKNMLTKTEYTRLLQAFNIQPEAIITQENHYFDTKDFQLKALQSGLRLRSFDNGTFECTLKERTSEHGHLETTDSITAEDAKCILKGDFQLAPHVYARLTSIHIPIPELSCFGSLLTHRVELEYMGGTLVLDHSKYLQEEDYEVEYEAINEKDGKAIFKQFLVDYQIEQKQALKKIARFMNAVKQKGM